MNKRNAKVIILQETCHVTSAGSGIDQSATSIQILPKQSRSKFLMMSHVRLPLWTLLLERIYNPITALGFSAMFIFQLDNTKR